MQTDRQTDRQRVTHTHTHTHTHTQIAIALRVQWLYCTIPRIISEPWDRIQPLEPYIRSHMILCDPMALRIIPRLNGPLSTNIFMFLVLKNFLPQRFYSFVLKKCMRRQRHFFRYSEKVVGLHNLSSKNK